MIPCDFRFLLHVLGCQGIKGGRWEVEQIIGILTPHRVYITHIFSIYFSVIDGAFVFCWYPFSVLALYTRRPGDCKAGVFRQEDMALLVFKNLAKLAHMLGRSD
jgi:hypothetical protein